MYAFHTTWRRLPEFVEISYVQLENWQFKIDKFHRFTFSPVDIIFDRIELLLLLPSHCLSCSSHLELFCLLSHFLSFCLLFHTNFQEIYFMKLNSEVFPVSSKFFIPTSLFNCMFRSESITIYRCLSDIRWMSWANYETLLRPYWLVYFLWTSIWSLQSPKRF